MVNLKDHNFPMESFIGGYYISVEICDGLINYYNDNSIDTTLGTIADGSGVHVEESIKDSTDLASKSDEKQMFMFQIISLRLDQFFQSIKKYTQLNHMNRFTLTQNWNIPIL